MAIGKHLSDGNPDGTSFGFNTSDLITFYGGTPIAQPAATAQSAVATTAITTVITTASTTSSPYGFATQGQGDSIVAAVNSLISRVDANTTLLNRLRLDAVSLNLIKGSN